MKAQLKFIDSYGVERCFSNIELSSIKYEDIENRFTIKKFVNGKEGTCFHCDKSNAINHTESFITTTEKGSDVYDEIHIKRI